MTFNSIPLLCVSALVMACTGQPKMQAANSVNHSVLAGDTVTELGKNIMVVYQDKKNSYWFGSWETGLYRYDGKTIINYTTKHGLPHNRVDEIKEDSLGNIYINGCYPFSAITKFDGKAFSQLTVSPNGEWQLQPNDLWFKHPLPTGQVFRFDGNVLHELQFPKHPKYPDPFEIYAIYKDKKGNIWFGSNPVGVCRYNGQSFDWISESDVTELHNGPANGVRSIAEDENGHFWFNTEYRYIIDDSVNSNTKTFYERQESIGNLNQEVGVSLNEYLSILKDNNNDLWMATYLDGVWKYDGTAVTHFPVVLNGVNITVFSVYMDNAGSIWLGTHENGAFRFNGHQFEPFRVQ